MAIDITNTNLKVEPLANKVTRDERNEVWYQQYNRRTHGRMSNAHGRKSIYRANNGCLNLVYWTTPGGSHKYVGIQTVGTRRTATTRRVKSWVRSELVLRQDLPESFKVKCATGGKMMMLRRLIYWFTVNKMILKYFNQGENTN